MENEKKRKRIKLLVNVLVSVFFIGWIVLKVNWQESFSYLKNISIFYIIIYLVVIFIGLVISSVKWKGLADSKGFKEKLSTFLKLYITGAFINNFIPSTVGGDVYRAYKLGKKEKRYPEATATVVDDRLSGLLALFIMTPIFSLINLKVILKFPILVLISGCFIIILILLPFLPKLPKYFFTEKTIKFIPQKILAYVKEIGNFRKDRKLFIRTMTYSVIFNLVGVGLANLILFWSMGIQINVLNYFSVVFIISILSSIPAGIGLKEWSYMFFFGMMGINISAAVIVAIINRFFQALINIMALPIYLKDKEKQ